MATKPAKHSLPRIDAPSHARQVYDRQTRRMSFGLKSAADVRNSGFWKKVRLTYISRNPLCEDPHKFHGPFPPPAQEVHHIRSIQDARELAFVHSNLMALCCRCHAVFSAQERKQ